MVVLKAVSIGQNRLADLYTRQEVIEQTKVGLVESEGYVDRTEDGGRWHIGFSSLG
jgi:hypothetical protein